MGQVDNRLIEGFMIFLTGVNGFLGSHVAFKLATAGHRVIALTRNGDVPELLTDSAIEYCRGDLCDTASYEDVLSRCDTVIHTAALASFDAADLGDYYRINHVGTRMLLETSYNRGVRRFIHTSTRGVLGVAAQPELSDESCPLPSPEKADDYVKSKWLAEREVREFSQLHDMDCIILSPTALIGAHDRKPTPIGRVVLSFLQQKTPFYMDGGLNLVDVEDAADAFVAALSLGENGHTYILGNVNIPLYELFKKLSEIASVPLPRIRIPFLAAYIGSYMMVATSKLTRKAPFATPKKVVSLFRNHSYCKSSKAQQAFNVPDTPLDVTLMRTCSWFKENSYI